MISNMISMEQLLQKAHGFFAVKQYDKALFLYSQASYTNPTSLEYQVYALLCDIASEDDAKGQELFDYFSIQKEINLKQAVAYIQDVISNYDGDQELISQMIKDVSMQTSESVEAIEYNDFLELEKARGSFKTAYEDIMFSTKVAIYSKDDLIDFINKLIENGFEATAYLYLDGFNEVFSYDKDLTALYEKLESKNIDNKQK
jgi:tetratricopeptide (TPR) repeat protein